MTIEATRERIHTDNDFVLEECKRLRYLYGLKREIRYAQRREEEVYTESVAEHIYGMHVLANYFLPLEDEQGAWDRVTIYDMITWHDIDEIETGDMLGQLKTPADRKREQEARPVVLANAPDLLRNRVARLLDEYESGGSPEGIFAKAIDKVEPLFEIFDENYREIFKRNRTTREQSDRIKYPYITNFPYITRFADVITAYLDDAGFFVKE